MFDRESSLCIEGGFGKFAMGRIGSINSGVFSWAKHGVMSAFGTSWGSYAAQADTVFGGSSKWDSMIAYETPDFAGFKVFAQYGMGNQKTGTYKDGNGIEHDKRSRLTQTRFDFGWGGFDVVRTIQNSHKTLSCRLSVFT